MKKLVKIFLEEREKELLKYCQELVESIDFDGISDFILINVESLVCSGHEQKILAIDEYMGRKYTGTGWSRTFDVVNICAISKSNPKLNIFSTYSIILHHETGKLVMSKLGDWRI